MRIINTYVDWHKEENSSPELMVVLDGPLPNDSEEAALWNYSEQFIPEENTTIYHGVRPDGFVRIYWDSPSADPSSPYNTVITVGDKEIELDNPAASSCEAINWLDDDHSIDATFIDEDKESLDLNYYTHLTVNKAVDLLKTYVPGVKLVKKVDNEYQAISYVLEHEDDIDTENDSVVYESTT